MNIHYLRHHWLVALLALLTLPEVHGQATAEPSFSGRPALAGAQGGTGAQAGPPQGGIGVQGGADDRRLPGRFDPRDRRDDVRDKVAPMRRDRDAGVTQPHDAKRTIRKSARNVRDAARHGVPAVGSQP